MNFRNSGMIKGSLGAIAVASMLLSANQAFAEPSHGIAMRGQPLLPADYTHFDYANPDAPKGGTLVYGVTGSFDDLNPFDSKSIRTGARGIWDPIFGNLVYEPLLKRNKNEPFTLYGQLAEKVEMSEDRKWIEFYLNPKAAFSDGKPVTVADVLFTYELLREKGRPPYSSRVKQTSKIEQTGEHSFKITFNEKASRETPMLFGLMPVLPKHAIDVDEFGKSTLVPPVGSGPYVISEVKPGEQITYTKNPNYWGNDIPSQRGFHNFETVRVDYYRGGNAQFEGFKKGLFDVYQENSPSKWRTAYDFSAANDGRVERETFKRRTPSGMLGFVFNTRRDKLKNVKVRQALASLFDFEWANANLFYGAYVRTSSYWQESNLSSFGQPASENEKAFLAQFPNSVAPEVLDGTYKAPVADGSGRDRKVLRNALKQLKAEGFTFENGKMMTPSGKPFQLEFLIAGGAGLSGQDIERLSLAYKRSAARLGIGVDVRLVDDSQYQARKGSFDYDITINVYSSSLSPGAEQFWRWGSASKDEEGSFNFAGVAEPAIDAAIKKLLSATSEEEFQDAVRTYDRLLISGHYVIPLYHQPEIFLARWKRVNRPDNNPLYGPQFPTWWHEDAKQ